MGHGKFYSTFSGGPYFNMAMDEWMFQCAIDNPGTIWLRLYTWKSGAITFGFNQNVNRVVNEGRLNGTPLIRRVTGGRALYHEPSELTYSIAVNITGLGITAFRGTLGETSRAISLALLKFLGAMDITAHYVRQSSEQFLSKDAFHSQPCFQSNARHEIVGENGKIIASAQRRIGDAFMQHGSIKISGVKSHPALSASPSNSLNIRDISLTDPAVFQTISALFRDQMGQSLEVDFSSEILKDEEFSEVLAWESRVKETCIFKREFTKQFPP